MKEGAAVKLLGVVVDEGVVDVIDVARGPCAVVPTIEASLKMSEVVFDDRNIVSFLGRLFVA